MKEFLFFLYLQSAIFYCNAFMIIVSINEVEKILFLIGCWYEGKRFEESSIVNTTEPCLRCRCLEGSLRCRLRVCPRIPNPPPVGCVTRIPHENTCCAELVCRDYR